MENIIGRAFSASRVGKTRYSILLLLFFITVINFADRAAVAITGPLLAKDLNINAVELGFLFSAFGWAYLFGQVPGGRLLDRYGSRKVYFWSILLWSVFTMFHGSVTHFGIEVALPLLILLRMLVGLAEAPSMPANSRVVAAWFPAKERGTATAIFNSAQYFATVLFAPIMAWIAHVSGWQVVFYVMGALGIVGSGIWLYVMHDPLAHPRLASDELEYIRAGGAQVQMDSTPAKAGAETKSSWADIRYLLKSRMMLGIYLGQFCISTLTYFFLTWFPVYLVQQRGMSVLNAGLLASIPAIFGFMGGILGGVISDRLLRSNKSLSVARKLPIIIGMVLSMTMLLCNYVDEQWLIITIMAIAFMGKGFGALGWAVMSDVVPPRMAGLGGGLFNTFGNVASIVTPIVIGFIIQTTGSFNGALVFVSLSAALAIVSYLLIVGRIERLA